MKIMTAQPSQPVRVRLAPSPTGFMHIGNLRAALYNWLFARHNQGTFILRVEDTDRSRYVEGAIQSLYRVLETVGLTPDEGIRVKDDKIIDQGPHAPYLQSKRRDKHLAYVEKMVADGHAYYCFCSRERLDQLAQEQQALKQPTMYDRRCRALDKKEAAKRAASGEDHVIRLAVPTEGSIAFDDIIRGRVEIPWKQVDDQVLIKSDGYPTYHLAATCDDHDMDISHVIRGEEWLSSMPKHLFIYQAMGWTPPAYAHLPLLLNPDKTKLSKRQGDVAAEDYLLKGYVPDALINFLALLGWNPTSDREVFSRRELIEAFDLSKVNKAGAVFNLDKLKWFNAHYLKAMPQGDYLNSCRYWLKDKSADESFNDRVCLLVRDRVQAMNELPALTGFMFQDKLSHEAVIIPWKKQTAQDAKEKLEILREYLNEKPDDGYLAIDLEADLRKLIADKEWGMGEALWPLRVALSGAEQSPGPFELLAAYGKERSLARIDEALSRLA